jgi:hypothetical protein
VPPRVPLPIDTASHPTCVLQTTRLLPRLTMGCFSSKPTQPGPPPSAREVASPRPPVPVIPPPEVRAPEPSAPRSRANSVRRPRQVEEVQMRENPNPRVRSKSTPDKPQARRGGEDLPPVPMLSERTRTKSSGAPSNRRPSTPTSAGERPWLVRLPH